MVRSLHGLIGQTNGSALDHGLCERTVAGEMEISEYQLAFSDQTILRLHGFLHLDDHVALSIHLCGGGNNLGSCGYIILVCKTAAFTGSMLYHYLVTMLYQFGHTCGRHANAILIVLDFFRNTNLHHNRLSFKVIFSDAKLRKYLFTYSVVNKL